MNNNSDNHAANSGDTKLNRALPQVRLVVGGNHILVAPPFGANDAVTPTFDSYPMPKIPMSNLDWAVGFCNLAWFNHRRCVAILLLAHTRQHAWAFGFPAQRCSKTAACWSVLRTEFPGLDESVYVGGSFQSRVFSPGEEPEDSVPPVDGLHIVLSIEKKEQTLVPFVRVAGEVLQLRPDELAIDDVASTLDECRGRLQFV